MPGIAGLISRASPDDCRRLVYDMLQSLMHESFYESGTCDAPELGVYAGWVAHAHSFAAQECTSQASGSVNLLMAGEWFRDGWPSRADSDRSDSTKQPEGSGLALHKRFDGDWVAKLNGLFSGLIVDRVRRRALLFNDRYGVERLYVHQTEHATYFASEAKALLRVIPELRAFDDQGVAEFLAFGCPLEGRTLFRGIRTLEAGSLWTFEGSSCRKARYFVPQEWESQPVLTSEAFESEFEHRFTKALPHYLHSDCPIGISLTGGLDTRMIMASLPVLPNPPICYTFAGLTGETLDARGAARVAAACGLEHRLLRIGQDFLSDYGDYVERTVYITDGSLGALGAHEIYLNTQARKLAPIRLTGNFGSEVLRGMSTLRPVSLSNELIAPDFRRQIRAAADRPQANVLSPVSFAAFSEIPWNLFGTMAAAKSQVIFRTPYLDNDLVALAYRAPSTARQSAATALHLIRNRRPKLSSIPTDRAVKIDGRGVRYLCKRLAAEIAFKLDYMHKEAPPPPVWLFDKALGALDNTGLLGRHKYLPYRLWFRDELRRYVSGVLTDPSTLRLPYWNHRVLSTIAQQPHATRPHYVREINAIVTLTTVDRLLLRCSDHKNASPHVCNEMSVS